MGHWKRLNGVAHNYADHCQSGLSFIQPHISNELKKVGKMSTTFELIPNFVTELNIDDTNPLSLALQSSIKMFQSILEKSGFEIDLIKKLTMHITLQEYDDYLSNIRVELVTTDGRAINRSVNH